jgi:hypothetical protein
LETIKGVGQDSAAVYVSGIDDPHRFSSNRTFRGWHGLIPDSRQSGNCEGKGLHITKAGPNLVKKYAYLDADVARQWDPQIAAIYYDQLVNKGKHHNCQDRVKKSPIHRFKMSAFKRVRMSVGSGFDRHLLQFWHILF